MEFTQQIITLDAGHEVVIHEQMGYLDGTFLYATKSGAPARFLLGGGQAIEGVDLGVGGIERRRNTEADRASCIEQKKCIFQVFVTSFNFGLFLSLPGMLKPNSEVSISMDQN